MRTAGLITAVTIAGLALVLSLYLGGVGQGIDGAPAKHAGAQAEQNQAPRLGTMGDSQGSEARQPVVVEPAESARPGLVVLVVDVNSGEPMEGVLVRAGEEAGEENSAGTWRAEARSDERGTVTWDVPRGVLLWIAVRGTDEHGAAYRSLTLGEGPRAEPVTLALPTGLDMEWYLRILASGDPVKGAQVRALEVGSSGDGRVHASTVSDDAGLVRIRCWSWKRVEARVRAGGRGLSIVGSEPGHETPATAQVVQLWPVGGLRAVLVDGADTHLPGVTVHLGANTAELVPMGAGRGRTPIWTFTAITDGAGVATLEDAPAETLLEYRFERDGRLLQRGTLTLDAGAQLERRFVVSSLGSVVARVIDGEGRPLADLEVWLKPDPQLRPSRVLFEEAQRATVHGALRTDGSGRVSFQRVPFGRWHVGVADFEGELSSYAEPVALSAEASSVELRLEHLQAGWIGGVIVDRDEVGIARVGISVYGGPGKGSRLGSSDDRGTFRIGPMPAGEFSLSLFQTPQEFIAPETLLAQAGQEDLRIVLEQGGVVRGAIRDRATGEAVPDCTLSAFAYESDRPNVSLARCFAADGEFELQGLPRGTVAILVRQESGRVGFLRGVEVRPPEITDAGVVYLHAGVTVRLRYEGDADRASVLATMDGVTLGYYALPRGVSESITCPLGILEILTEVEGREPVLTTYELDEQSEAEVAILGVE